MDFRRHAPLKAGDQTLLEFFNLAGRAVARKHDLLVGVVQRIECMEKFLLAPFLAGEKLDVIDEKHIGLTVFLAELHQCPVLNRVDELVCELLARQVNDLRSFPLGQNMVADGVQKVRFSKSAHAVNEEWIVGDGR